MNYIAPVVVGQSFVDVVAAAGLNVNRPVTIENVGAEQLRYTLADTAPADLFEIGSRWLSVGERFILPRGHKAWFNAVGAGLVSVQYADALDGAACVRAYPDVNKPRIQTTIITAAESYALLGINYRCVIEFDALANGASKWIRLSAPANREGAITSRVLSCKNAGAEYRLYRGSSGFSDASTPVARPQNARIGNTSLATIRVLSAQPTVVGNDYGPLIYVGAGSSGVGNAQAGTSSRESGFTIYGAGQGFEAKITNLSGATNDIKLTLEWVEFDGTIVSYL